MRRRELGTLLRRYRTEAGLSVKQVTESLMVSAAKISRMETGHRPASPRDVRDLCDLYGIDDPDVREHLMTLAREGKQSGWWQAFDLPTPALVGLEASASRITEFQTTMVPGLLQTPEYANAVTRGLGPSYPDEQIGSIVRAKLIRQKRLKGDDAVELRVILDEAALHRHVGGVAVMCSQLEHLLAATDLPNVSIRVIPYDAGAHPGLNSTFMLLDFDEPDVTSVVFIEGLVGFLYLEQPADLERYRRALEALEGVALGIDDSRTVMRTVLAQFRSKLP